jgi:hypothetical protein
MCGMETLDLRFKVFLQSIVVWWKNYWVMELSVPLTTVSMSSTLQFHPTYSFFRGLLMCLTDMECYELYRYFAKELCVERNR